MDQEERVRRQLAEWRDGLIDLTKRNGLLYCKVGRSRSIVSITEPSANEVVAQLFASRKPGWGFAYPDESSAVADGNPVLAPSEMGASRTRGVTPVPAERGQDRAEVANSEGAAQKVLQVADRERLPNMLRNLERRSTTEFNDKGIRILHLGVGMLDWTEGGGIQVRSPLLLIPVELKRPSPLMPFGLFATEDDPAVNPPLSVKLAQDFGIELPPLPEDELDPGDYLSAVERAVRSQEAWSVSPEVILGAFTFHKEAMYRDLLENEDKVASHPLVRAISGDISAAGDLEFEPTGEDELDSKEPPETLACILDADSTQRQCIIAARDRRTFVMDGPPGTGKSQTIANTIAQLLAAGRTVLFVSEKAAALDVVKKRLDGAGLGNYVLELHSAKATRKEVAATLGAVVGQRPQPPKTLSSADLERVRRRREELSAYAVAQNEVREPLGASLHWILGRCQQLGHAPTTPPPEGIDGVLSAETFSELIGLGQVLVHNWGPVSRADVFVWRELADPADARRRVGGLPAEIQDAREHLARLREELDLVASELSLDTPTTIESAESLVRIVALLEDHPVVPLGWLTADSLEPIGLAGTERRRLSEELHSALTSLDELLGPGRMESVAPTWADELRAAMVDAKACEPAVTVEDRPLVQLRQLASNITRWLESSVALELEAASLAQLLGLTPQDLTPAQMKAIAEVASLRSSRELPEAHWLTTEGLAAARHAVAVLQPIVVQYRAGWEHLRQVFTDAITQLNVERLFDGPQDQVAKLSRLSARGRENRKALAACCHGGKLTNAAIAMLPLVRQWTFGGYQLYQAEAAEAASLGPFYYRRTDTDFSTAEAAIAAAERALALLGATADPRVLGQHLGRGSDDLDRLGPRGKALYDELVDIDNGWASFGELHQFVWNTPIASSASWATRAGRAMETILRIGDELQALGVDVTSIGELLRICGLRAQVASCQLAWDEHDDEQKALLGEHYAGAAVIDGRVLDEALAWTHELRECLGGPVDELHAEDLLRTRELSTRLSDPHILFVKKLDQLMQLFTPDYAQKLRREIAFSFDDADDLLRLLGETVGDIDEWTRFATTCTELRGVGMSATIDFCIEHRVAAELVPDIIERSVLEAMANAILVNDPRCSPLRSGERDALVSGFQELDRQLRTYAAAQVIEACNAHRPSSSVGEVAIIRREAEKKSRHRPIRTLLAEAGGAAQALKPCFMMSPLSVSQFLPATMCFDAVIFDEASQVRPGDALNAIYRGSQLIVAGDDKQLPPTSFFQSLIDSDDDEYIEDDIEIFESVLDLCKATSTIPSLPLRWHYRSRHESLITYSNRSFYGNLITYPGAIEEAADYGIGLYPVPNGVYQRGTTRDNPIEAAAVIERVFHHAEHHRNLTLGVVAFSEAQASRIAFELERARQGRPHLDSYFADDRLDGFFVKNLENVQGDERDIIIFSIGYGKDEFGKFTQNFGPINREGGHRRLNVAITRARRRVEVVTSITARDFTPSGPSVGLRHLHRYLDYCERGMAALASEASEAEGEPESPFEEMVLATIRGWGYDAVAQVGQAGYRIDIGVRHPAKPGEFMLGVECDGAAYHSSRVARDRDRLRQEVLEGLAWKLHRIWGPAWYRNRAHEEARLLEALRAAGNGELETHDQQTIPDVVTPELEVVDLEAPPEWSIPYTRATLEEVEWNGSSEKELRALFKKQITELVQAEGPILYDVCLVRLKEEWRFPRLTMALRGMFESAVNELVRAGTIARSQPGFLVCPNKPVDVVRRFVDGEAWTKRTVDQIHPDELALALLRFAQDARSISHDELTVRTARLFGWGRRGPDISAAMNRVLERLVKEGRLALADGHYRSDG